MADFKGRKRGKSHVQNMGIFFGGSGHGPEPSSQISAYYKFFPGFNAFCRISTGLYRFYRFFLLQNTTFKNLIWKISSLILLRRKVENFTFEEVIDLLLA